MYTYFQKNNDRFMPPLECLLVCKINLQVFPRDEFAFLNYFSIKMHDEQDLSAAGGDP